MRSRRAPPLRRARSTFPSWVAASMGRRNTCLQFIGGRFESHCLSRTFIQPAERSCRGLTASKRTNRSREKFGVEQDEIFPVSRTNFVLAPTPAARGAHSRSQRPMAPAPRASGPTCENACGTFQEAVVHGRCAASTGFRSHGCEWVLRNVGAGDRFRSPRSTPAARRPRVAWCESCTRAFG